MAEIIAMHNEKRLRDCAAQYAKPASPKVIRSKASTVPTFFANKPLLSALTLFLQLEP